MTSTAGQAAPTGSPRARRSHTSKATDVRPVSCALYFLPVETRVPLKFGPETLTHVTCARVRLTVSDGACTAEGWGETPLSVQWVWPSSLSYQERHEALQQLCIALNEAWARFDISGHPMEVGHAFQQEVLPYAAPRSTLPCTMPTACCTASRRTRPTTPGT
jgi:hypothetical protein